jgi:uncharacterized protein (DUF433 family)
MDTKPHNGDILGKGAYSVGDASRLAGIPDAKIRRWLLGRNRSYGGRPVYDPPLWTPTYPLFDDSLYLSFRDLIELRLVDRFRQQQISMPYLRKVVEAAREVIGDSHPFSTSRFKTDGRRLYLELLSRTAEPRLIEVLSGQHAFHSIISVGLKDLEFDEGVAVRWHPEVGQREVVVDPHRSFGRPILTRFGIPTETIEAARRAGRSAKKIARDFEIDEKAVRAALAFEGQFAA